MVSKSFLALAGASAVAATCAPPFHQQLTGNSVVLPNQLVYPTKGQPFTVTWAAAGLSDTVTIYLLRGPGSNIINQGPIAVSIPNTGTYTWTPDCSLEADTTHYGLQLVDDVSCDFQYTTQFGMSQGTTCGKASSSAPAPSSSSAPSSSPAPSATSSQERTHPTSSAERHHPSGITTSSKPWPTKNADGEDCDEYGNPLPKPSGGSHPSKPSSYPAGGASKPSAVPVAEEDCDEEEATGYAPAPVAGSSTGASSGSGYVPAPVAGSSTGASSGSGSGVYGAGSGYGSAGGWAPSNSTGSWGSSGSANNAAYPYGAASGTGSFPAATYTPQTGSASRFGFGAAFGLVAAAAVFLF